MRGFLGRQCAIALVIASFAVCGEAFMKPFSILHRNHQNLKKMAVARISEPNGFVPVGVKLRGGPLFGASLLNGDERKLLQLPAWGLCRLPSHVAFLKEGW